MNHFNQIAPLRAYQLVLSQLEEAIISGKYASGEKLPPERELIDVFGTSRRTLREAFRVLEQKGLIEIKIGAKGGTFITNRIQKRMSETLSLLIRKESVANKDISQFRAALEGEAASLATQSVSKLDLKRLEQCYKKVETFLKVDPIDIDDFVQKELDLHQMVADLSGNALYGPIVRTIHDVVLYNAFVQDMIDKKYIQKAVEDWRNILDAMKESNPEKAKKLTAYHITGFETYKPSK